jgi:hypothetical protein
MRAGCKIVTTDPSDATGRSKCPALNSSVCDVKFLLDESGWRQKAQKYQDQKEHGQT